MEFARWRVDFGVPGAVVASVRAGHLSKVDAAAAWVGDEAMSVDTVFDVASLTKPLFAAAMLRLVTRDQFDLDLALHAPRATTRGSPRSPAAWC
jgi:CubicO group peptidase (beta-lactamase class C family)